MKSLETINNLNELNQADFNRLSESQQYKIAQEYNLTCQEYKKYLYIKNNTAIGQYYADRNLSPQYLLADYYLQSGGRAGLLGEYVYNATNVSLREVSVGYNLNFENSVRFECHKFNGFNPNRKRRKWLIYPLKDI